MACETAAGQRTSGEGERQRERWGGGKSDKCNFSRGTKERTD